MEKTCNRFSIPILILYSLFLAKNLKAQNHAISGGNPEDLFHVLVESMDPGDFENEETFKTYIASIIELFPLDLNQSGRDDLLLIPGITARQADAIIAHREHQAFTSVSELTDVPGIGPVTLNLLRPWVTTGQKVKKSTDFFSNLSIQQFFRYQQTFPKADGFQADAPEPPHYVGSPARLFHRQTVSGKYFLAHFTQVKLPGEKLHGIPGFDFSSAHIGIQDAGILRRLVIGDFSVRYGQGLVLWTTPSFGKGGSVHTAPFRRQHGISPYRSSDQIRFFRGAATEIELPAPILPPFYETGIRISTFYSNRARSAVEINNDTIRPPTGSPFHRTALELSRRKNVNETVYGGRIALINRIWNAGASYYSYSLDKPVSPLPHSSPFQGVDNDVLGTDITIRKEKVRFFAEYAARITNTHQSVSPIAENQLHETGNHTSKKNRYAWIAGITGSFSDATHWSFSRRDYRPGYWSELGNGFGEGSGSPTNQSGWYFGLRHRPDSRLIIHSFIDRFYFPEPRNGISRSSGGWETLTRLNYRFTRKYNVQLQVRYKERLIEMERTDAHLRVIRSIDSNYRLTGRLQLSGQLHPRLLIRTQFDGVRLKNRSTGLALTHTVRWQAGRKLHFDMSWSAFETEDFASRIYLFEHDVTHAMGSTMVYGVGQRSYMVSRYRPASWLLTELKLSKLQYSDRPVVGSGHDRTIGPGRFYISFQIRLLY